MNEVTLLSSRSRLDSVVVAGLGNTGSRAMPLLAGIPAISRVDLIDFDRYEAANLGMQRIVPADVGRSKAKVQAAFLRRMRHDIVVATHECRFEDMPLGTLRDRIILSCVDSRSARQAINRAAFALGSPWIDAAIAREGSVRARAFLPAHGGSCMECSWGLSDYQLVESRLPCVSDREASVATAAPSELGAIAAALQVSLLRRLVTDIDAAAANSLADRQFFFDVPSGRGWAAAYTRNPECRLDHARWDIVSLGTGSVDMPLQNALALSGNGNSETSLSAPGFVFVHRIRCAKCGWKRGLPCRISRGLAHRVCTGCGAPMQIAATDSQPYLAARNASASVLGEPLARRGFVAGDIVSIGTAGAERHFELA